MDINPYQAPETDLVDEKSQGNVDNEFYVVSKKKFAVMFFMTMSFYEIYWFYKNWKNLKLSSGRSLWPVPRAIFSIFFTHSLFSEIQGKLVRKGFSHKWKPGSLATTYVVISIVSGILDRMSMKEIGSPITDLLSLLILPVLYIPLVRAQEAINVSQNDPKGQSNDKLSGANYFWIVIGGLVWLLAGLGLLMMAGIIQE